MFVRSLKPQLISSIKVLNRPQAERRSKKVWIETYGCSASMADSEMITGLLKNAGYEIAANKKESGLNLIVTCSVKDTTEHKMVHRIKQLSKTGKPLVVAGCLPKADRSKVELSSPQASIMGPHSIDKTVDIVDSAFAGSRQIVLEDSASDKINIPKVRLNPVIGIIEIATGCMSECTFCQTKLAKGWLDSYRIGDIMRQIRTDVEDGCKEIWLTSTDNGCYGRDKDSNLVELLSSCCDIAGDFKIRVGMMNPQYVPDMLDKLVDVFYKNDKLFRFIHIPVQSGSDSVLRKMKRGHSAGQFSEIVKAFRQKMPDFTVATDVIAGFPTETESDFQKTIDLLTDAEPDVINISKYSARPGTESASWKGVRINTETVKHRTERLHVLSRGITKRRNAVWNGWHGELIVDEVGKVVQGRNYAYKPIVLSEKAELGTKIRVEVYSHTALALKGRVAQHC